VSLIRPSGGLRYHLRARLRRSLWQDFQRQIAEWLEAWNPPRSSLILIGPSGGYTLPQRFLASFGKITAYDLDPLAPWLFRQRHPHANVQFVSRDMFWQQKQLSLEALQQVLAVDSKSSVIFSNILGQLPLENFVSESEWQEFLSGLRDQLNSRWWASYHDLLSIEPLPLRLHQPVTHAFRETQDIQRALAIMARTCDPVQVNDHMLLNSGWSAGLEQKYFSWTLGKNRLHIIGGVHHSLNLPSCEIPSLVHKSPHRTDVKNESLG
jgi:hypothetical protein